MRQLGSIMTAAALVVTLAACGGESEDRAAAIDDGGLDVCSLVSDETVEKLQSTSVDPQGEPAETLMEDAELFVECRIIGGVEVGYAVRAAPGGPMLEELVASSREAAPEPLAGVGDQAMIATNTFDGMRIAVRVGDQEVIVNSNAYVGEEEGEISRDDVIALAKEVAGNLGDEKPGAIRLPKGCPSPTAEEVQDAVGTTLIARGTAASNGSVSCSYVSDDRKATLSAVSGNQAMGLMALADSPEENRIEVDGRPALYDEFDGIVVFADDECVLGAAAGPLGWSLADPASESERRDRTIELVKYVEETIGCP